VRTYDVNASAETAFRLELGQCLRGCHFFVDLGRVVHVHSSVVCRRGQEFAFRTHGQSPMLASLFA
jgi:hypothetical protein